MNQTTFNVSIENIQTSACCLDATRKKQNEANENASQSKKENKQRAILNWSCWSFLCIFFVLRFEYLSLVFGLVGFKRVLLVRGYFNWFNRLLLDSFIIL